MAGFGSAWTNKPIALPTSKPNNTIPTIIIAMPNPDIACLCVTVGLFALGLNSGGLFGSKFVGFGLCKLGFVGTVVLFCCVLLSC